MIYRHLLPVAISGDLNRDLLLLLVQILELQRLLVVTGGRDEHDEKDAGGNADAVVGPFRPSFGRYADDEGDQRAGAEDHESRVVKSLPDEHPEALGLALLEGVGAVDFAPAVEGVAVVSGDAGVAVGGKLVGDPGDAAVELEFLEVVALDDGFELLCTDLESGVLDLLRHGVVVVARLHA